MLREPPPDSMGASVFSVATCCHTIMCIDHPFYEAKFCMDAMVFEFSIPSDRLHP